MMQIKIFVKLNAKKTALLKVVDGVLHIAIHAKPKDGEANIELIRFLSELYDVPNSQIELIKGETSRHKTVSMPLTDIKFPPTD